MEFFDSINQVRSNWEPYKKWEAKQRDKDFQRDELQKRNPASKEELEKASQYGRTLIDSINIMDQYAINKAEDVELVAEAGMQFVAAGASVAGYVAGLLLSKTKKISQFFNKMSPKKALMLKSTFPALFSVVPLLVAMPITMVKSKSYQKEASRVARYQAREQKLKDPKHFVIHNSEQIEQAKEIAKNLPDVKDTKKKSSLNPILNWKESISSIKSTINDHKNYESWKKQNLLASEIKLAEIDTQNITPEKLNGAKKDQDNLLRIIRKVETYSQNYLNDAEFATNVVAGSSILSGFVGGKIVDFTIRLLQKMKVISLKPQTMKKIKNSAPFIGPIAMVMIAGTYMVKIQKEAARVGRFKAKQELLNNPNNFTTYTDEQLEPVKDLKAPKENKGIIGKIKNGFKITTDIFKDFKEYEKYKKNQEKEDQKLSKALTMIDVSESQLKDAKALQKNAFMAFESLDEMAQRYSDDTEAATGIFKLYSSQILSLGMGAFIMKKGLDFIENPTKVKSSFVFDVLVKKAWVPAVITTALEIFIEWQANRIEKQAGRIGVMKAMQDLEDPRLFVNQ